MSNVASFEKSKELKENGFLQPKPDVGQIWYNKSGKSYIITFVNSEINRCDYVPSGYQSVYIDRLLNDGEIFAPTATDILKTLSNASIGFFDGVWEAYFEHLEGFKNINDENPAEAAAKVWLKLNSETHAPTD